MFTVTLMQNSRITAGLNLAKFVFLANLVTIQYSFILSGV